MAVSNWRKPKAPGKKSESGTQYIIPSRSKYWGPWIIEAEGPRKRDFWKVLRGRWIPQIKVLHSYTMAGYNRELKETYGPRLAKQLNEASPLLELFDDVKSVSHNKRGQDEDK
jgi:hypothetical protein